MSILEMFRNLPTHPEAKPAVTRRSVGKLMAWVRQCFRFSATKRLIWAPGTTECERVGSHCFVLARTLMYIQERYLPHLDRLKLIEMALVHDDPEYLEGDTPNFRGSFGQYDHLPRAVDKHDREERAMRHLAKVWRKHLPGYVEVLDQYHDTSGDDEYRRLVSATDKFIAEASILLDEGYTDKHLGVSLGEKLPYKRARMAEHPLILEIYDELLAYVLEHRTELLYREGDAPAPRRICPECRAAVLAEQQQTTKAPT